MLLLLKNRQCCASDITVTHLARKLNKLDNRIQLDQARPQDYFNRERVAVQLSEAKRYLC